MPSPFYFFDEVDAALDTMNAARVAEYMAAGGACYPPALNLQACSNPAQPRHLQIRTGQNPGLVASSAGSGAMLDGADRGELGTCADEGSMHAQQLLQPEVALQEAGEPKCSYAKAAGAQYIVVSHRPQVFERAACLVGVYSERGGASGAVVARFPNSAA